MIKLPFAITTTISCTILSLCTLLLQIQPVNAGISSFHDLQKKLSPSPLDVLDNLDMYEKFWIEVHPKSCGEFFIILFVCSVYCKSYGGQFMYVLQIVSREATIQVEMTVGGDLLQLLLYTHLMH